MKIRITIGNILLILLITISVYNLYYMHTGIDYNEDPSGLQMTSFIYGILTYILLAFCVIFIIKEVNWDKIFSKGFTINLNGWKNKNNN